MDARPKDPGKARPANRWKRRAARAGLVVGTLAALALLLEGATRLLGGAAAPLKEFDETIGGRYLPGFEGSVFNPEVAREVTLRFNADGFRGADRPLQKPPGTRRIAALGDSMVAALEVDEPDTMVCVLERLLNERSSEPRWEVMNFGLAGSCPSQELMLYRNLVRRYRPDIVLLAFFCGNDLTDCSRRYSSHPRLYLELDEAGELRPAPRSTTRDGLATFLNRHSRFYVWQKDAIRKLRDRYRKDVLRYVESQWVPFLEEGEEALTQAWAVTEAVVRQFAREVQADGGELVLVVLPCGTQVYADRYREIVATSGLSAEKFDVDLPQKRLADLCRKEGIRYASLVEAFRAAAPSASIEVRDEWLFNDGCNHFNERGNRLAAETTLRFLAREQSPATARNLSGTETRRR